VGRNKEKQTGVEAGLFKSHTLPRLRSYRAIGLEAIDVTGPRSPVDGALHDTQLDSVDPDGVIVDTGLGLHQVVVSIEGTVSVIGSWG
jgi:hypothetical protein